jgi:hypothetical protein
MRKPPALVAGPLLLVLAACGTAEPGKDFAGNQVSSATSTTDDAYTDTTTDDSGAGYAAESPSSAPVGVQAFKMGGVASVSRGDENSSGTITVSSPQVYRRPTSPLGSRPKNGRFLRVTVTASGASGVFSMNPFYFHVIGADGTRYETLDAAAAYENADDQMTVVNLNPGEKLRATLVFDVPKGVESLAYDPLDQTLATWKVTVK